MPPTWCETGGGKESPNEDSDASESLRDEVMAFLADEARHLADLNREFWGGSRAQRAFGSLRNHGLKLIWFQASRGCCLPPTGSEAAAYFAKVAEASDTTGGEAMAKSALRMICIYNDPPNIAYTRLRVNAALEAMRRSHRQQTRKAAGLTIPMVGAILVGSGFVWPGRPATRQWELMIGVSIGLGFKLLLRYGDLRRCYWDEGSCEVFVTHIRLYRDGRKKTPHPPPWL